MEFMNRNGRAPQSSGPVSTVPNPAPHGGSNKKNLFKGYDLLKVATMALVLGLTILLVSVLLLSVNRKPASKEASHVDNGKMQAVFLNGGQVYFGNIKDLNDSYVRLSDIYYLRVNQQVQPDQQQSQAANDISLVKLGCELHGPEDEMLINREQVVFWENLKTDGQVADAVKKYKEQNPNGQDCNQAAGQTQQQGQTPNTQPQTSPNTSN